MGLRNSAVTVDGSTMLVCALSNGLKLIWFLFSFKAPAWFPWERGLKFPMLDVIEDPMPVLVFWLAVLLGTILKLGCLFIRSDPGGGGVCYW